MHSAKGWIPLIQGAQKDRALERLAVIHAALRAAVLSDLTSTPAGSARPGAPVSPLASGDAGAAIFFQFATGADEADGTDMVALLLNRAFEEASKLRRPGLFTGTAGVGLAAMLCDVDPSDVSSLLAGFDAAIARSLDRVSNSRSVQPFDLISGLGGLGVYFAERLKLHKDISRMTNHWAVVVRNSAVETEDGFAWIRQAFESEGDVASLDPIVDLSVARGAAGVEAALQLCETASSVRSAVGLITRSYCDSDFGLSIPMTRNGHPRLRADSRLAWCYGDLGMAAALLCSCPTLACGAQREILLAVARSCAAIPTADHRMDAALCHGTAGAAHMFARLYQLTGENVFADAAQRWYSATLDQANDGQGLGGFTFGWNAEGIPNAGFLRGVAGVGLALSAGVLPGEPAWDAPLLTSVARFQ